MCDLVVLGRKKGRNDRPNFLPPERPREANERGVREVSAYIVGKQASAASPERPRSPYERGVREESASVVREGSLVARSRADSCVTTVLRCGNSNPSLVACA